MQDDPKSPLHSKTIIGAVALLIATLLRLWGYDIDTDWLTRTLLSITDLVGTGLVVYGRFTATQPLRWR